MLHLQTALPSTISPSWNPNLASSIYSFPLTPSPNQTRTLRIPSNHSHQHQRLKPYHRSRSDFDLRTSVLSPITPNSSTQHSIPCYPQTQSSSVRSSVSREPAAIASAIAANIAHSVPSAPQTPRATIQRSASLPQLQLPFPITPNSQLIYPSQVTGPAHAPIFTPLPSCPHPGTAQKPFIPPSEYLRAHLSRFATVQAYAPTVYSHPLKTFVTNTNYGSSHRVQRSGSGLSLFIPSCSYVDPTTSSITSIPHPDETFGSRQDVSHEVKEVSERRKETEARDKQVYAMELVEIAIKTVNRVWPESRDMDTADEESNTASSPLRSTAGSRHGPQQLTPASSPVMVPSSKKRKIGSVVKVEEDEDELQHSAKRRSVGVEERPSRSPSSYLPYRPSQSPTSMQYTTPASTNPITLRLFVRELLRRSKTSVQTLEVALCYLDGIEDTVQMLRESYKSGKGYGTPELAQKGPYDEGSKDEGRILRLQDVVNTELVKLRMKVRSAHVTPLSPTSDVTAAGSCTAPSSTEKQVSAMTHKVESLSVDAPYSNSAFSSTTTAVMHSISPSVTVTSDSASCPLIFKPPKMTPHQLLGTHPLLDARRTFLSALVLATKFLQDRAYSNKAWAKLSGLPGKEVGRCERALGGALGWRLWVGKDGNGENIRGISSPVSASSSPVEESVKSPSAESLPWTKVDDEGVHGVDDPLAAEFMKCANAARDREEQQSGFAKALEMKDVEGVLSIPGMREYIVLKNKVANIVPSQTSLPQPAPLRRQGSALVAGMVEMSRPEPVQEQQEAVDRWSSLAALEKETPIAPVDIQTWSEAVANLVPSGEEGHPFLPPGYVISSDTRLGRTPLLTMTERLPEDDVSSGSGIESGSSSPLPPFVVEHQRKQLEALSQQQHPVQQQQAQWIVQQYQTGMQAPQFYCKPGGPGSMSAAAMDMLYKPSASASAPMLNNWNFSMQPQHSQHSNFVIPPPSGSFAGLPPYHPTAVHSTVYMSPYSSPDDAPTPTQHSTSTPSCSSLSRDATLVDPLGSMDEYLKVTDGDRTPIAPFMMQPYF